MDFGCKVVVSLALVKAREPNIRKVIQNLNNQSTKPEKIHIWISDHPFYLDKGFKEKPKINYSNVEINFTENIGGARKFIPVLKKYWDNPEQIIILTDDDHIWHKHMIRDVVKYADSLNGVISTAGNFYKDKNRLNWRKHWFHGDSISKPTRCDIISTGYGCLIKPKYFTEEIFDWKNYEHLGVPYDDEFWFNAMLAKNNVVRYVVPTKSQRQKLEKHGVDMFKTKKSRQCKAWVTQEFKNIIIKTGAKKW